MPPLVTPVVLAPVVMVTYHLMDEAGKWHTAEGRPSATAEGSAKLWPRAVLIFAAALIFYIPAIKGGFIWDDGPYLTNNPLLTATDGLYRIWFSRETPQYYPLVFTTFWIERHIFDLNPLAYHTVNVLIHSMNAVLVYVALKRIGLRWAFAAALIFALHPVNVESVAWITERKNVLSGLFYLSALNLFLKHDEEGSRRWYALSLTAFLFALFSKTVASTLPITIILIGWMQTGRVEIRRTLKLLPFFLLGVVMGLVTVWWEVVEVGARGAEWSLAPPERFLIAGKALWFYAGKFLFPFKLTFIYPRWALDAASLIQWLYPLFAVVIATALFILRGRIGRAPLAALLAFAVALFPALGFFDVYPFRYSFVADHFSYLAAAPIIAAYTGAASFAFGRLYKGGSTTTIMAAALCIISIGLGILTWKQGHLYSDRETLWRDTIKKNPSAWIAHNNLGVELAATDRVEEAVASYRRALELRPEHEHAHANLANSLTRLGRNEEAIKEYTEALRINPLNASAAYNLATTLSGLGRKEEAISKYRQALRSRPGYAEAHNNLANLLYASGDLAGAIRHYEETVRLRPGDALPLNNLGIILSTAGRGEEALTYFARAIKTDPGYAEAHYNMGLTLSELGRKTEALEAYRKAVRISPVYAAAHNNLGRLLLDQGLTGEAVRSFEKAAKLEPENESYRRNAAIARKLKESGQ